jgi:hypothetical protein
VRFSRIGQRSPRDAGLRHLRLATASWVAIPTSAAGFLIATKATHTLIVAAVVATLLGLAVVAILTTAEQRAERRREQAEAEEAEIPVIELPLRDRVELIERIWGQRIVNGLDRSLQHAVEIELGLREAPELLRLSYAVTRDAAVTRSTSSPPMSAPATSS